MVVACDVFLVGSLLGGKVHVDEASFITDVNRWIPVPCDVEADVSWDVWDEVLVAVVDFMLVENTDDADSLTV